MGPQVEALAQQKNVRLRKIDIASWSSPVAKQFGIRSIPALWLYEGTERVSTDTRDVLNRVSNQ